MQRWLRGRVTDVLLGCDDCKLNSRRFVDSHRHLVTPLRPRWSEIEVQFNARETAKVLAVFTAVPAALGAVVGTVAFFKGESATMICVGVGFWWALVVFGWAGYFVAYRRSKRAAS